MVYRTCIIILAAILCGCSHSRNSRDVIYSCNDYTVLTDRLISNDGEPYRGDTVSERRSCLIKYPQYSSKQRLVNRLYQNSIYGIDSCRELKGGVEACYAIFLSYACLDPITSMAALREQIVDGRLFKCKDGGDIWPLAGTQAIWSVAAWELYKVTGDKHWLREARDVTASFIDTGLVTCMDKDFGLFHGMQGFLSNPESMEPQWMGTIDRYEAFWLATNVSYAQALHILSLMDAALGSLETSRDYERMSKRLTDNININFWLADKGYYSSSLYGGEYPLQSPVPDNLGQSLSVLFSVATEEMAASLLSNCGVNRAEDANPLILALWSLAAARVDEGAPLCAAIGALYHHTVKSKHSILNDIAIAAINLRVIGGVNFEEGGISFSPSVPAMFRGEKVIDNFRYRNSVLRIEIAGTGNSIESFSIDGKVQRHPFFDADMEGQHTLRIMMTGELNRGKVLDTTPKKLPHTPEVEWKRNGACKVCDFNADMEYKVYLNGAYNESLKHELFAMPASSGTSVFTIVPIDGNGVRGFSCRPYWFVPKSNERKVQLEYFAKRGSDLISDKKISRRFVETSPYKNKSIRFHVDSLMAGEYFLDVCYADGADSLSREDGCAMRILYANGYRVGAFVFPYGDGSGPITPCFSNKLTAALKQGTNRFEIVRELPYCGKECAGSQPLLLDYVRIIRK